MQQRQTQGQQPNKQNREWQCWLSQNGDQYTTMQTTTTAVTVAWEVSVSELLAICSHYHQFIPKAVTAESQKVKAFKSQQVEITEEAKTRPMIWAIHYTKSSREISWNTKKLLSSWSDQLLLWKQSLDWSLQAFKAIFTTWSQGQVKHVVFSCFLPSPYNLISSPYNLISFFCDSTKEKPKSTHLNRGPMAATCRFKLPFAPPMFRDRDRWSRLEKISIWSELQYLAISNLCTKNWEKETDIPCLLWPFWISNPTPRLLCFKHLSPPQWLCSSKQSVSPGCEHTTPVLSQITGSADCHRWDIPEEIHTSIQM